LTTAVVVVQWLSSNNNFLVSE